MSGKTCIDCAGYEAEIAEFKQQVRNLQMVLIRIADSDESDLGEYAKFAENIAREALKENAPRVLAIQRPFDDGMRMENGEMRPAMTSETADMPDRVEHENDAGAKADAEDAARHLVEIGETRAKMNEIIKIHNRNMMKPTYNGDDDLHRVYRQLEKQLNALER